MNQIRNVTSSGYIAIMKIYIKTVCKLVTIQLDNKFVMILIKKNTYMVLSSGMR